MSLPSVTEILKDAGLYGDIERWSDSEAMRRGRLVDAACNLLLAGKVLETSWEIDHPECVPFIDGYRRFLQKHRVIKIDCAFEVRHKTERYMGHPDQLVMLDGGVRALLDLKTGGMPPICNLQLAGYELAMRDMGMADARELLVTRFGLQLARGDFKLHPFPDPRDRDEFTILVRAWHIKRKYIAEGL